MGSLEGVHSKFMRNLFESSKLNPTNAFTIIPSVLFLVSIFALLYLQFHRHISPLTRWKTRVCKDIAFHWTFFYSSRIWFLFLKACKWMVHYSDKAIEKNSSGDEAYYNKIIVHFCIFTFALSLSLIPCLILYVRYINRRTIPNFLMWVAEDPWVRSEIGTSGHYLERPPSADVYGAYKRNASYRSGRSSSVDTNIYLDKQSGFLRTCKSAMNVKRSLEDIIG